MHIISLSNADKGSQQGKIRSARRKRKTPSLTPKKFKELHGLDDFIPSTEAYKVSVINFT